MIKNHKFSSIQPQTKNSKSASSDSFMTRLMRYVACSQNGNENFSPGLKRRL